MTTTLNPPGLTPRFGEHGPRQTLHNALIITRREMRDSFRDWRIMGPILLLTIVFPALAQGATGIFVRFFQGAGANAASLLDSFLPLMPMIVGFFPVSISLVIALETFVGEKERRSLEPLLSTPLTNTELYIGKTLAAMLPPLLASYLGIGIYLAGLIFGTQQWRPELELIIQILALTTAQALVMVTGAVVVSSQTTSTRAANLLASFIIIPISLLVMLDSFIMVTNNHYVLWYIIIALILADIILFSTGARIFNREELLGRQLDEINLSWAGRMFRRYFGSGAHTVGEWYRLSVFPAVRRLGAPATIVIICMVGAFVLGFGVARVRPDLQMPTAGTSQAELRSNFERIYNLVAGKPADVFAAVLQNGRVLVAATFLAIFSFGVMGLIFAMVPFGILGYLFGQPLIGQLGAGTYIAAVLPHNLIQVPAMILATAAALRLGAVITHPAEDKTVGEAFLGCMADCVKIGIGLVLPLLIVAGLVELFVTPRIVQIFFGG